jgi:predicted GNAT superfamily acetyltransferase
MRTLLPSSLLVLAPEDLTFRSFDRSADYHACVDLQKAIWGQDFSDVTPSSVLKISQKVGSVAAGAFAPDGRMLGFVWGLTGVRNGQLFHWSHMLGVHSDARDLRLGTRLKLLQRELLLPLGVQDVEWTYDPLEARNAHLNLNHLGAEPVEYVEDMYAGEMGSDLAQGIGTDRFIVRWRIASDRVANILAGGRPTPSEDTAAFAGTPILGLEAADETFPLPEAPRVRIEIPASIQEVKTVRPDEASVWRQSTRRAFQHYFARGYRVAAYLREGDRRFYGLERP